MIYAVWMLHIVDFSDEWWGLLAIGPGHYHGMKLSTSVRAFTLHPNHGRKFAYDTTGIWHSISQQYQGINGSRGFWLGLQPRGHRRIGRPKYCRDTMIANFCRRILSSWEIAAIDVEVWRSNLPEFLEFCKR